MSHATAMIGTVRSLFIGVNPYPQSIKGADFGFENDGLLIVIMGFGGNCLISTKVTRFVAPKAVIHALFAYSEK